MEKERKRKKKKLLILSGGGRGKRERNEEKKYLEGEGDGGYKMEKQVVTVFWLRNWPICSPVSTFSICVRWARQYG
jgi:hypothetical protein